MSELNDIAMLNSNGGLWVNFFPIYQRSVCAVEIKNKRPILLQPQFSVNSGNSMIVGAEFVQVNVRDDRLIFEGSTDRVIVPADQ